MKRGYLDAAASAVCFGITAPLAKRLVGEAGSIVVGGLLYSGAGLVLLALGRVVRSREAQLSRRDIPLLASVIAVGGVAAPLSLMVGLARCPGTTVALLLNLEVVFTVLIAVLVFRDWLGHRGTFAIAAIVLGAVAAVLPGATVTGSGWGLAAVVGACLAWGIDNNLTRQLSDKDPMAIAAWKGLLGGSVGLLLAIATGAKMPSASVVAQSLALGAVGYGVSLVLFIRALRHLGTARTGALFATAPFVGAIAALPILGESIGAATLAGAAIMAVGVALLLGEQHDHEHEHLSIDHQHLHVHDEHHQHEHDGGEGAAPHSHRHRHVALRHTHPHLPDLHHQHRH